MANRVSCCGKAFEYRDLDAAIVPGVWVWEGNLVWLWLCPLNGCEIRREPFAYPVDMPDFTSSQPDARTPSVESGGMEVRPEP